MLNKVIGYGKSHKKYLLLGLVILVVIAAFVFAITDNSEDGSSKQNNSDASTPEYSYLFISSNVSCKEVPAYPGAPNTLNTCSGDLNVKSKSGETSTYKVTGSSHFYKNGSDVDLTQLNTLESGKSKLALTFFAKEFGQGLNGIFYVVGN
jgi:hypothetical protein